MENNYTGPSQEYLNKEFDKQNKELLKQRRQEILKNLEEEKTKEFQLRFFQMFYNKDTNKQAVQELVDHLIKRFYIKTLRDDKYSETYIYLDGIYVPQGKTYIKEYLIVFFKETYSMSIFNMLIAKIEPLTYVDSKEFFKVTNPEYIPLKNGLFHLRWKQLYPFTPDFIFFQKLDFDYNKDADCPRIKSFLQNIVKRKRIKNINRVCWLLSLPRLSDTSSSYAYW